MRTESALGLSALIGLALAVGAIVRDQRSHLILSLPKPAIVENDYTNQPDKIATPVINFRREAMITFDPECRVEWPGGIQAQPVNGSISDEYTSAVIERAGVLDWLSWSGPFVLNGATITCEGAK